jgi:phosphomannomutase
MTEDLKITISGIRGIVGKTFTLDRLIGWVLAWEKTIPAGPIILGRDARPHGTTLQDLTSSALQYVGRQVYLAGLVPTPTIGVLVREFEAAGGIMLTASHNPVEWNALKIFNNKGLLLTPDEFGELLPIWKDLPPLSTYGYKPGGETSTINHALDAHIAQVYRQIDTKPIEERHFKVVVDGCKSVGGLALPEALRKAGVRVLEIDCWPDGAFTRGLEPVPENLDALCEVVVREKADLGMAVDPDSDRLALVSEKGEAIGEELTLVLAAESVLQRGGMGVVSNISTTMLLDQMAEKYDSPVYRSKVGESHVVDMIREKNAAVGGEGNGGVILPGVQLGRDAISGALLVLDLLAREKKTLSEKVATYPPAAMVKAKIPANEGTWERIEARATKLWPEATLDRMDGLKWIWKDRWLHLRSSNTEPILRIIAEAPSREEAQRLVDSLRDEM